MKKKSELEQAYIDRENYQKENNNPISLSIERQKELLEKYPNGLFGQDYFDGKLTDQENGFLMFDLVRKKYGRSMSLKDFAGSLVGVKNSEKEEE
jgi:hypothetical protein